MAPGNVPAGIKLPVEVFSFTVTELTVGSATTVTLFLPSGITPDTYYKFGPTPNNETPHWYEFLHDGTTGAEILADKIILHFVDGKRGDDDLNENGVVIDAGGPAVSYSVNNACKSNHELERVTAEPFSCELPILLNDLGEEVETLSSWEISPGQSLSPTLPPGLDLVERGNKWLIEGTVTADAPLESRTVNLRRAYPDSMELLHLVTFNTRIPVNVWTQNLFLRPNYPTSNTGSDNRARAGALLDRIYPYDIVALQEVFDNNQREQLEEGALNRNYNYFYGPTGGTGEEESGLMLLVKQDWAQTGINLTRKFDAHCDEEGWDNWADKGVSLTTLNISKNSNTPSDYLYVMNVHTQAGDEPEVRKCQLQVMRNVILPTAATHPALLMGDFNVQYSQRFPSEYWDMLETLAIYPWSFDWRRSLSINDDLSLKLGRTADPDRNAYAWSFFPSDWGRLDYILLRQGAVYRIDVDSIDLEDREVPTTMCAEEGWLTDPEAPEQLRCYLSDHFGIKANLKFSQQKPEIRSLKSNTSFLNWTDKNFRAIYTARSDTFQPVTFYSNMLGDLGTQENFEDSIIRNDLPNGKHVITSQVNDPIIGMTVSAPIVITIENDRDQDWLSDKDELRLGTNPDDNDTDGDGLFDGLESKDGLEIETIGSDPLDTDSDDDGIADGDEVNNHGTSPINPDSDGDGFEDRLEVFTNSDPTSKLDVPKTIPENTLLGSAAGNLMIIDQTTGKMWPLRKPADGFGFGLAYNGNDLFIASNTQLYKHKAMCDITTEVGLFGSPDGDQINVYTTAYNAIDQQLYGVEEAATN